MQNCLEELADVYSSGPVTRSDIVSILSKVGPASMFFNSKFYAHHDSHKVMDRGLNTTLINSINSIPKCSRHAVKSAPFSRSSLCQAGPPVISRPNNGLACPFLAMYASHKALNARVFVYLVVHSPEGYPTVPTICLRDTISTR